MKYIKKIYSYLQGNIRYFLYYSESIIKVDLAWLIPIHIQEQIEVRISTMNPVCYAKGSCIECGCTTTKLQMADIACDGNCYPKMLSEELWKDLHSGKRYVDEKTIWELDFNKEKFVEYKLKVK